MRVGVLALQGDFREHARSLAGAGAEAIEVRTPQQLADVAALVIPGGESTTIGRLAERSGLIQPLRARINQGMPALGTCAGMIFLASATTDTVQVQLGVLDVIVERNAFGRQVDSFETELAIEGLIDPFHAVFIRAPLVAKVGADVEVLARVDDRAVMVRQGQLLATAFHPELTDDLRIHRQLLDLVRED